VSQSDKFALLKVKMDFVSIFISVEDLIDFKALFLANNV
jgi:hypothetical protein